MLLALMTFLTLDIADKGEETSRCNHASPAPALSPYCRTLKGGILTQRERTSRQRHPCAAHSRIIWPSPVPTSQASVGNIGWSRCQAVLVET